MTLRPGDTVQPSPAWAGSGLVPSGTVRAVVPWGGGQVVFVAGDHRGLVADVFAKTAACTAGTTPEATG